MRMLRAYYGSNEYYFRNVRTKISVGKSPSPLWRTLYYLPNRWGGGCIID